jgi:hypothetical protein
MRCHKAMKGSALNELLATVVSWTLRIAMVLAGLVFFASLMVVAAIAAMLWAVRLLWAKVGLDHGLPQHGALVGQQGGARR